MSGEQFTFGIRDIQGKTWNQALGILKLSSRDPKFYAGILLDLENAASLTRLDKNSISKENWQPSSKENEVADTQPVNLGEVITFADALRLLEFLAEANAEGAVNESTCAFLSHVINICAEAEGKVE